MATEGSLSVALDTTLDESLLTEGIAREIINRVQAARRDADLDVTDRITVRWSSEDDAVIAAFDAHADLIGGEVLAASIERAGGGVAIDVVGHTVDLAIEPTG